MFYQARTISDDQITLPKLPSWVTSARAETPESMAFLSGATFVMLDALLQHSGDAVPTSLLANTLALKAAVATSKLEGRMATEADIRDAYHLTPAGDQRGPDGDMLAFWRDAVRIRVGGPAGARRIAESTGIEHTDSVGDWIAAADERTKPDGPVAAATHVMRNVLEIDDRAEGIACLLSDVVLARYFGWQRPLPLTAPHITKSILRDLKDAKGEAEASVHQAIIQSAQSTYRLATTLATRADALRAVAPKLRTKGSDDAVALFLSEDAVAPSGMLSPAIRGTTTPMTARAARRLCDRLVELGVAKELTGRPTFRLYGIAT